MPPANNGPDRMTLDQETLTARNVDTAVRAVTLRDVAREAGVSPATASKALNGRSQVKAETRARVLEVARRLGFGHSATARGLPGRAGTVGIVTSDLRRKSSLRLLMGAENALAAEETGVYLCDARGDAVRERHHARALLSRRVDGIVVVGARPDPRPSLGRRLPVPVVYVYAPSDDEHDISIVTDNVQAGAMAVEHLIAQRRTHIAHITGDITHQAARDRAEGGLRSLRTAGLSWTDDRVLYGRWDEAWGRGATRLLLDSQVPLDGIFAGSDQIARGAVDALQERGVNVPQDVAVIGFDNLELLVANARPQLTSVDMQLEELGASGVQQLFRAMDGQPLEGSEVHACRIVQRGSTAALS